MTESTISLPSEDSVRALRDAGSADALYALLPALAGTTLLDRGGEPLQKVKWLFDRRNELVHPKLRRGDGDLTWDPQITIP
jgi:hypothetical protein